MTIQEALAVAEKYNLKDEIADCIDKGSSPIDALAEWGIL